MTSKESLTYKIQSEYILLRHFKGGRTDTTEIEVNFNKHLKEYKDLTGHDFQLEELINKLDNNYECD